MEVSNQNSLSRRADLNKVGEGAWIQTRVEELRNIKSTDTYIQSPAESPDLLAGIFHLLRIEFVPLV